MSRRQVIVNLGYITDGELFGSIADKMRDAEVRARTENIHSLRFDIGYEMGYYNSVTVNVNLIGTRDETDEEVALRERDEQQQKQLTEAQQRQMYEKLKKKFGGRE